MLSKSFPQSLKSGIEKTVGIIFVLILALLYAQNAIADSNTLVTLDWPEKSIAYAAEGLADNNQLAADYLDRIMPKRRRLLRRSWMSQGAKLTGAELNAYNLLYSDIASVANGSRSSTIFSYDAASVYPKTALTVDDLHVSAILKDNDFTQETMDALNDYIVFDADKVIDALMADCPFELYWYDKTVSINVDFPSEVSTDGSTVFLSGNAFFYLHVAAEYALNGQEFECDTTYGQSAQAAAETAQTIVNQYADASDEKKIAGFAHEICGLTDYNYDALEDGVAYGNPWQLIWVFDGNPDTKVVCEGYAKAFQYLCDLSTFSDGIAIRTVTGNMDGGTGAGAHMWNVVHLLDGNNYLVDVTNIDEGFVGSQDQLLMAKYSYGDFQTGYTFVTSYGSVHYAYDEATKRLYAQSEIELSSDIIVQRVALNEENFPDANFRKYLQNNFDTDGDLELTETECAQITFMNVSQMDIVSLEGMKFFPNLKDMIANYNDIEEIDLRHNPKLVSLHLFDNKLTEIDLSQLPDLKYLTLDFCPISSIDVSHNPLLNTLRISPTGVQALDISHNAELEYLDCQGTKITELDVTHNPKLIQLICQSIHLTDIDLSQNAELTSLWISDTDITELDLSHNTKLDTLFCAETQLKALDLSNNPLITDLRATGILSVISPTVQTIDTAMFEGFDKSKASQWEGCTFDQETGMISNITDNIIRYRYQCNSNLSIEVSLYRTGNVMIDETNFPDPFFREYIRELSGADQYLTPQQLMKILYIDVANMGITTLKGIELFPNLVNLNCRDNPVSELSVSSHRLFNLYIQGTKIKQLNLGRQPSLASLFASSSELEVFHGEDYPELIQLDISNTKIHHLDLLNNPDLIYLDCLNVELYSIENCPPGLEDLRISETKISEIDLKDFKNLYSFSCSNTEISELKNLSECKKLRDLSIYSTKISHLDVSKLPELISIDCRATFINQLDLEGTSVKYLTCNPQILKGFLMAEKHENNYTINISGIVTHMDRISFPEDYVYDETTETLTFETLPEQFIYYYDTQLQSEKLEVWCDVICAEEEIDLSMYNTLYLPKALTTIEREAFSGISAEVIVIPESCTQIEADAFASCKNLRLVIAESRETIIDEQAFGNEKVQIVYR